MGLTAALVTGLAVVAPTSAGAATGPVVFDDMEHGDPFGNGWFTFGGDGGGGIGGGGIDSNNSDLPPADGGSTSLQFGWGSGGTAGFFGGFGRTSPTDLTATDHFNFWINPDAGQDYTLEINLQEDDNKDGSINASDDDEFQFNCVVSDIGPCAVAGSGWQLVSIPFADFSDDNSFLTGGNGILDPFPESAGGNGQLINVVVAVISNSGADVTFRTDYWAFLPGPSDPPPSGTIIDDFESGVDPGTECPAGGLPLGFCTFQDRDRDTAVSITTEAPQVALPDAGKALKMDVTADSYAGFTHGFTDGGNWVPQDWSTREGISFWMFGAGTGQAMFIDILDNRKPGSTTDDAERFFVRFNDDFSGWQKLEFPFSSFVRKDINNGAPNDGLTLFEMHGYAIGVETTKEDGTPQPRTIYVDNVALYGEVDAPPVAVNLATDKTEVEEGTTGQVRVKLNRPLGPDDPAQVSIDFATERSNADPDSDYTPTSGTLVFESGGPSELSFPVETFDNSKFTGDKQIVIRLTNPVDVERGALFQGSVIIVDNDAYDPKLLDDFEQGAYLWSADKEVDLGTPDVRKGNDMARPDQDKIEAVLQVDTPVVADIDVMGSTCVSGKGVIPVHLLSTPVFDARQVDHTTVRFGDAEEAHTTGKKRTPKRHVADLNGDGLKDLLFHFRAKETGYNCESTDLALTGTMKDGTPIIANGAPIALGRDFPMAQDWSKDAGLSFWYYGTGSGEDVTVTLKENRLPDPGPEGWELAWSDEFDGEPGDPPNPANWSYELGDSTPDGKNGWGNEELQYYTDDAKNAAIDGDGNLVITLTKSDTDDPHARECYYGLCEYESARLVTQHKAEFAYGRIESRLRVPTGKKGLWPAFWSLGTDITYNPWPEAGEIDYMEYVSKLPTEVFGTIHGPGYAGGASYGSAYDFGDRVDNDFHTFTVEWEPKKITWYVDGIQYHEATPDDVNGPWVFEKPFFMLLNFAIGGNFGGEVDPDNKYPQEYLVDYVRLYQAPDTAERWETTFTDTVAGWSKVTVPLEDPEDNWTRSADQPAGAPDDRLTLDEVWGYGFEFPRGGTASGTVRFDLITVDPKPKPVKVTVTNLADSGDGSLRQALEEVAEGGAVTFDPSLAGGTLTLTSGQLAIVNSVTIDGPSDPVTISGGGASRVFQIAPGTEVTMNDLVIVDGVAAPKGGGILNEGSLRLERVIVTNNQETSTGTAFDLGGGGIYNGDGAVLKLTDSTVSNNSTVAQPAGGIYGFFNSSITIERSTISGNVSGDVAGGLRTLGDANLENSTISGNTSSTWHGGAWFATDGTVAISNSTIVGNNAPSGTAGGLMVATFGAPVDVSVVNTIVADNGTYNCQVEGGGAAVLRSLGSNVFTDPSCGAESTDRVVAPGGAGVGALADNGGPTLTHALQAGSPAIDAADTAASPATDQRGVDRPQGSGPDIGSFELEP